MKGPRRALIPWLCSAGLCSGDPESLVGHRDMSALRNAPRQPRVPAGVCVLPGMSAAASPLQTLPVWGHSRAVKPQDESLWVLTHLTTCCKLWISSSPSSGESFGLIWEDLQGFACSFAWQMNGLGLPAAPGGSFSCWGHAATLCSCSTGATCGRFTRQKSPGISGLICRKLLQTICASKIMLCFDGLVTRTFNPAS